MATILIVEDEKELKETLSQKLTEEGFKILSAENGKEGLELLEKNNVDLILLDILMPRMDGIEMIHDFAQNNPNRTCPPVVVITNTNTTAFPTEIQEVLVKSNVTLQQVIDTVKKHIV